MKPLYAATAVRPVPPPPGTGRKSLLAACESSKSLLEQIFRTRKCDMQMARLPEPLPVTGPPVCCAEYFERHGDLYPRRRLIPAESIDGVVQSLFAPAFPLEFFPIGQAPGMIDHPAPVDQESPAGLVAAAKSVQQCDGLRRPQSEQAFDDGAVYHRVERFRCDAISGICNSHRVLAGGGTVSPVSLCSRTVVPRKFFLTYDNAEYSIGSARHRST